MYLHTKQIVCKKKKQTNKQGSGTTANEKSHCWSVDSPREQMFLKKRPEIPVLSYARILPRYFYTLWKITQPIQYSIQCTLSNNTNGEIIIIIRICVIALFYATNIKTMILTLVRSEYFTIDMQHSLSTSIPK